ncbi:MAG: hypothetical protein HOA04_02640 [Euryarchaeota archaeon]|jgi:hypothetical protein|nr:hypothetical protein [Euryarchaeota archaeon]
MNAKANAPFMLGSNWSRFVLSGNRLLPGSISISDKRLLGLDVMLEIRRKEGQTLPISVLKTLGRNCSRLLVDPHTDNHQDLIDCIMMGSSLVCIDHRAQFKELQSAHATSQNIVVKLELNSEMLENPEDHLARLETLSDMVGELIMVKTRQPGILEEWWIDLPRSIRSSWRWIMAPAEGEKLPLKNNSRIHSWALSGDLFLSDL